MASQAPTAPIAVYLLAEHLDGALAAGEDLVARGADWRTLAENPGDPGDFAIRQRALAEDVRGYELILIARIMKARDHAKVLGEVDGRFASIAQLFVSGTAILADAAEECGDATQSDFDTADCLIAYVRSRGLIAPDAAYVLNPASLTIDDTFLIAKRLMLGPLLDMAAAFLDALETYYELFLEEEEVAKPAAVEPPPVFGKRERVPVN